MVRGQIEADIAAAVDALPGVTGVYALAATAHADAYEFAIVLEPFTQRTVVEVHCAIVSATDTRRHAGNVLYVNGGTVLPSPMANARRVALAPYERAAADARIGERRATRAVVDRVVIEDWFREIAAAVFEPAAPIEPAVAGVRAPYRGGISVDLRTGVLAVVADPFPYVPRPRVLVIDEDDATARALGGEFEVTHVDESWGAIDAIERTEYDAVLCALKVGAASGASLHRMIAKTKPELAPRIAFLASAHAVEAAPASSTLARVLARPVTVEAVRALLSR